MVAVSDFSGLAISTWALASAPAIKPMVSLERGITGLLWLQEVETDGAGLRAPGAHPMADGFPGVFWHQFFEVGLGAFMFLVGRAGPAIGGGKFRPGVGAAHIHDPDRLDPWPRRLDAEQVRRLARLDTAPELLFGGQQQ